MVPPSLVVRPWSSVPGPPSLVLRPWSSVPGLPSPAGQTRPRTRDPGRGTEGPGTQDEGLRDQGQIYFFLAPAAAGFTSMLAAVIRYMMVAFAPTFRSPVTFVLASRAISHFSVPFCTTTASGLTSSTGPVTWYVFVAAKA